MPWSLDTCSTQCSPVHRVQMHGVSNRDTHLYPPHNNSLAYLRTTTYVPLTKRITDGTRSDSTALRDSVLSSPTPALTPLDCPRQEQRGSGLTASAPVSNVSTPAYPNGVCPPLRPVSAVWKNKPSTMLSSNFQSIDLPMDCTA